MFIVKFCRIIFFGGLMAIQIIAIQKQLPSSFDLGLKWEGRRYQIRYILYFNYFCYWFNYFHSILSIELMANPSREARLLLCSRMLLFGFEELIAVLGALLTLQEYEVYDFFFYHYTAKSSCHF